MIQELNQYYNLVNNSFIQIAVMGLASNTPLLIINGYEWSIAGLIIPMMITSYLLFLKKVQFDFKTQLAIMISWLMNLLLVIYQAYKNFPGSGIHLFSLVYFLPILELIFAYRNKTKIIIPNIEILIVATFFSMLPCDMIGAIWMWIDTPNHPSMIESLTWIGGAGWKDGLLLGMLSSLFIWIYVYILYQKEEKKIK